MKLRCLLFGHNYTTCGYYGSFSGESIGWVYKCQNCGERTQHDSEVFPDG